MSALAVMRAVMQTALTGHQTFDLPGHQHVWSVRPARSVYLPIGSPRAAQQARASPCWPVLESIPTESRSPERLLAVSLTHCHGLQLHMVDLQYITTHFAGKRNRTFDLRPEMDRLAESARSRHGQCEFCLRVLGGDRVKVITSLVLSRQGVRVVRDGNRSAWSCRARSLESLRFSCVGSPSPAEGPPSADTPADTSARESEREHHKLRATTSSSCCLFTGRHPAGPVKSPPKHPTDADTRTSSGYRTQEQQTKHRLLLGSGV